MLSFQYLSLEILHAQVGNDSGDYVFGGIGC